MNTLQDNPRSMPSQRVGEFTSEMYAILGNLDERLYLLVGQKSLFNQFFTIGCKLCRSKDTLPMMTFGFDFGGKALLPGEELILDDVVLIVDNHANQIQDAYFDLLEVADVREQTSPLGWCSWYYYFTKIDQNAFNENLDVACNKRVKWTLFQLDDGYQTAVGDWLSVNAKFPQGLKTIADKISEQGMLPGLWLAPFIARRNSRLYCQHPEWALRSENGQPIPAGYNPNWGWGGIFYGLDVTHPDYQRMLRHWIRTIVHEWGYRYLKLDFLYAACLPAKAYDPSLSPAERLKLGYRIIREEAGGDIFLLGCGAPLSASVGLVNAMRVGCDVAPYWYDCLRIDITRDANALCTRSAIRNILNRCQMHRRLWINDPDCLMLRETHTKLSREERFTLTNAIIISGGMCLVSDRLKALSEDTWSLLEKIVLLARECDQGRPWALDYMEREIAELVYNDRGYLAVFNFADHSIHKCVPYRPYLVGLVNPTHSFEEVWEGRVYSLSSGELDLGVMPPHSSVLLKIIVKP